MTTLTRLVYTDLCVWILQNIQVLLEYNVVTCVGEVRAIQLAPISQSLPATQMVATIRKYTEIITYECDVTMQKGNNQTHLIEKCN